jgi:prefoldin subunit 5
MVAKPMLEPTVTEQDRLNELQEAVDELNEQLDDAQKTAQDVQQQLRRIRNFTQPVKDD